MSGTALHTLFDVAAWLAAGAGIWWLSRARGLQFPSQSFELSYIAALVFGAGTRRLSVRHAEPVAVGPGRHRAIGRGRAGRRHRRDRALQMAATASRFAPARVLRCRSPSASRSAGSAAISPASTISPMARRRRCPGDMISATAFSRHPVQLYESLAMAAFAGALYRGCPPARRISSSTNGFYLALGLVRPAALPLGVLQALWRVDRPSDIVPPAVARRSWSMPSSCLRRRLP